MKKGRAHTSVGFLWYGKHSRVSASYQRGFAPIIITAVLSVAVLFAAVGWEVRRVAHEKEAASSFVATYTGETATEDSASLGLGSASSATSTDLLSFIGPAVLDQLLGVYVNMQESGSYTPESAQKAAEDFAPAIKAPVEYLAYQTSDLKVDSDTSYTRMLTYRSALREALAPLLENTQPEYEIFGLYVQTGDTAYLSQLQQVAQNYHDAQTATASILVPRDAMPYHIGILNAMGKFGATVSSMGTHADDPFATVALLRSYNEAEADMLTSFNALTTYYKSKTP